MTNARETGPSTWRKDAADALACPHRDLSVCAACAAHPEVLEVAGAHYHDPDGSLAHELEVLDRVLDDLADGNL
jgi:hypothetical protein